MPYLNLKEASVTRAIRPLEGQVAGEERDFAMRLDFDGATLARLREALAALEGPSEVRVELAGGWTLFWKTREGESRMLVAHPEAEQWVATLALSPSHWRAVLDGLASLANAGPGDRALAVHGLEAVSSVSNLELELGRA